MENSYFSVLAGLKRKIKELTPLNVPPPPLQHIVIQSAQNTPRVKLPQIHVPHFIGDLTQWNSFFQIFSTLIHNNDVITDVQTLIYLKSYLSGEPLNLIQNIQLTNDSI